MVNTHAQLPQGFSLVAESDGYALKLDDRTVASATTLDNGGCRVCTNPDRALLMHFHFPTDTAAGVRLMQAWARKWEAEIRETYDGSPIGLFTAPASPPET